MSDTLTPELLEEARDRLVSHRQPSQIQYLIAPWIAKELGLDPSNLPPFWEIVKMACERSKKD